MPERPSRTTFFIQMYTDGYWEDWQGFRVQSGPWFDLTTALTCVNDIQKNVNPNARLRVVHRVTADTQVGPDYLIRAPKESEVRDV